MCCQPFPVQRAEQLLGSGDAIRSRYDHGDVHGIHGVAQGRVRPVAEDGGADLTQSLFVGSGHADSRSTTVSASASVIAGSWQAMSIPLPSALRSNRIDRKSVV